MKRRILCVFLCLVLVLGCFAVHVFAVSMPGQNMDWGFTLMADEVTPTGMTLVMSQFDGSHQGMLKYDGSYWLEVRFENRWKRVHKVEDVTFAANTETVRPDCASRIRISWERLYGELPSGYYRLGKTITNVDYDGTVQADFYTEFSISDPHTCYSEEDDRLCNICLEIAPHECLDENGDSGCEFCGKSLNVYRVVGNADWMGNWAEDNEMGIMTELESGVFSKVFEDVPPGAYEFKITQNGKWDNAYGTADGMNYTFVVRRTCTVTVDFRLKGDVGVISVTGPWYGWDEDEEEDLPGTADLTLDLPTVLLTGCALALVWLTSQRKRVTKSC